jgi:hypothetical protein
MGTCNMCNKRRKLKLHKNPTGMLCKECKTEAELMSAISPRRRQGRTGRQELKNESCY